MSTEPNRIAELEAERRVLQGMVSAQKQANERFKQAILTAEDIYASDSWTDYEGADQMHEALRKAGLPAPTCQECGGTGKKSPMWWTGAHNAEQDEKCMICRGTGVLE